jgi:hypothetical protein
MSQERAKWLPRYPDPEPGQWIEYSYSKDTHGWHLTVGNAFHADVAYRGTRYYLLLNLHPISDGSDPEALKLLAEQHIVARVQKMIPAYKAIYARVNTAKDTAAYGEQWSEV